MKVKDSMRVQTDTLTEETLSHGGGGELCERFQKQHEKLARYEQRVLEGQNKRAKQIVSKLTQRDFLRRYSRESSRNHSPKHSKTPVNSESMRISYELQRPDHVFL